MATYKITLQYTSSPVTDASVWMKHPNFVAVHIQARNKQEVLLALPRAGDAQRYDVKRVRSLRHLTSLAYFETLARRASTLMEAGINPAEIEDEPNVPSHRESVTTPPTYDARTTVSADVTPSEEPAGGIPGGPGAR